MANPIFNTGFSGYSGYLPSGTGWTNLTDYLRKANVNALSGLDAAPDYAGGIDLGPTEAEWNKSHTVNLPEREPEVGPAQGDITNPAWTEWERKRNIALTGGPMVYNDWLDKNPEPIKMVQGGDPGTGDPAPPRPGGNTSGQPTDTRNQPSTYTVPYKPWGEDAKIRSTYDSRVKDVSERGRAFDNFLFRSEQPDWAQMKPLDNFDPANYQPVPQGPPRDPGGTDGRPPPPQPGTGGSGGSQPGRGGTGGTTGGGRPPPPPGPGTGGDPGEIDDRPPGRRPPRKPGVDDWNLDVASTRMRAFPGVRW